MAQVRFIIKRLLKHEDPAAEPDMNGLRKPKDWPIGSEITLDDETQAELIAELRRQDTIALPTELAAPQDVANQMSEMQRQIEELKAALESAKASTQQEIVLPPSLPGVAEATADETTAGKGKRGTASAGK